MATFKNKATVGVGGVATQPAVGMSTAPTTKIPQANDPRNVQGNVIKAMDALSQGPATAPARPTVAPQGVSRRPLSGIVAPVGARSGLGRLQKASSSQRLGRKKF